MIDIPDKTYRSADGLVVRSWDEEFAVAYLPSQAKTHLIDEAAATILQLAGEADVTLQSLLLLYGTEESSSNRVETSSETQLQHLTSTLTGLLNAGLLRSAG